MLPGECDAVFELLKQERPVRQPGQLVVVRQMRQLRLGAVALQGDRRQPGRVLGHGALGFRCVTRRIEIYR